MCDHRARRGGRRGLGRISASPLCHCLLPVAVYCVVTGEVHFDSFQIRHIRVTVKREHVHVTKNNVMKVAIDTLHQSYVRESTYTNCCCRFRSLGRDLENPVVEEAETCSAITITNGYRLCVHFGYREP